MYGRCSDCKLPLPLGIAYIREEIDPVTGDRRIVVSVLSRGLLEAFLLWLARRARTSSTSTFYTS
jgi:hypothetical protein